MSHPKLENISSGQKFGKKAGLTIQMKSENETIFKIIKIRN